ncbi:MAG: 2-C-methyl-D-erythritol 2,4-cyclodiphosphate synthase [Cellvibrionales bacterium TMED49]|nr:2-C-methyl-D-erythritol 2,4-cyclodiphosphate synthase [Porticoccaceae bacterium]OUU38300.1 MAG: 2-C-methyl-D-erythritol 2,4-cyclodiphosphate synthase [Cellvibrionales bacterium TMED49]
MRIGHGYDVHAFSLGTGFTLGGVHIPYEMGLLAHSDGDVVIHALMDAILGALSLGDIGVNFSDSDPEYLGINSRNLLRRVVHMMSEKSYQLVNADMTIVAQEPKMAPYIKWMCTNLAHDIGVSTECINVKATTTEMLGFIGRTEGIACHAVVLLESSG